MAQRAPRRVRAKLGTHRLAHSADRRSFATTRSAKPSAELALSILADDYGLHDAKQPVLETKNLSAARIEEIASGIAAELAMERT